ncbi:cysteine-rich KTR domain-containing protein [Corynebacterium diphtheriae]
MKCEWILCPVCGSKTRNKIRKDTVLENYPLYWLFRFRSA